MLEGSRYKLYYDPPVELVCGTFQPRLGGVQILRTFRSDELEALRSRLGRSGASPHQNYATFSP